MGPCGAADKVGQLAHAKQLMEGGVVLGMESGHLVALVETVNKESAADLGEESGRAGHNTGPALVSHTLRVPAVRKNPSKRVNKVLKHNYRSCPNISNYCAHCEIPVDHKACHPCLQGYVLAYPLDIAVDLVSRNPGQGKQVLAVVLWEALVVTVDYMNCLLRMAGLSFLPLGP